jgi:isoquinoline 1-oxidoreductase beta subunit
MSTLNKTNRRDFLKITSLTGGGLVLGFSWFGSEAAPVVLSNTAVAADLNFNSYLSIATDGTITILSPNPELGQNIMTSFPMIVAEELDADWSKVKVLQAPLDKKFDRQSTGGSGAIPHSWKRLRTAGATARYLLIALLQKNGM